MSLEAIDMVMKAEQDGMSRRAAAEQEARNLTLNAERDGQAMLMSVKTGQRFIMDRIDMFGGYDSCPEAMSIDPGTELAYCQFDMDYEVVSTNGRARKSDRLKLNLYLDVKRRAMALLRHRIEIEGQKAELEEMLRRGAVLQGGGLTRRNRGWTRPPAGREAARGRGSMSRGHTAATTSSMTGGRRS